jgi:hypothetical protein
MCGECGSGLLVHRRSRCGPVAGNDAVGFALDLLGRHILERGAGAIDHGEAPGLLPFVVIRFVGTPLLVCLIVLAHFGS